MDPGPLSSPSRLPSPDLPNGGGSTVRAAARGYGRRGDLPTLTMVAQTPKRSGPSGGLLYFPFCFSQMVTFVGLLWLLTKNTYLLWTADGRYVFFSNIFVS
jgi:hypothetical protein